MTSGTTDGTSVGAHSDNSVHATGT